MVEHIVDFPAFLILSHQHDKGVPLSIASLQGVAAAIRIGSGVEKFHWHLGRHAFFNRAYASIIDFKEKDSELHNDRLRDLVYWGGGKVNRVYNYILTELDVIELRRLCVFIRVRKTNGTH